MKLLYRNFGKIRLLLCQWKTMQYQYPTEETATRKKSRQKLCCIFCGGLLFGCWLLLYIFWADENHITAGIFSIKNGILQNVIDNKQQKWSQSSLVIQQPGCHIPGMSVMGPMVTPYIFKEEPISCDAPEHGRNKGTVYWPLKLFEDSKNALSVVHSSLELLDNDVECSYRSFSRAAATDEMRELDRERPVFTSKKKALNLTGENYILSESEEFVKVECSVRMTHRVHKNKTKKGKPFYEDFFAFVPPKKEVEDRCQRLDQDDGKNWINVAVLGLDALSRLNFQRQMPLSHSYLVDQMGAIEMYGFNKVGDNTFPNLVPTLMNLTENELKDVCWPEDYPFFDNCPFIWNQYRDKGYRTAFVEDTPKIAVFNYLKKGFHNQPTDYYPRPYFFKAEATIGRHFSGNCYLCLGSKLSLSAVLNYAQKFLQTFYSKKFFGFFWSTSFTHDYLNLPSQGDEAVLSFLRQVYEEQLLNHTVLVVLSDHGLRWGDYRNTFQGHLEERLPLLMFAFPAWFQAQYPQAVQNIRDNAHKLTTHFDLHNTMVDLLNLTALEDEILQQRPEATGRSQSLFQPVASSRNCSQAGIPRHYCTCHDLIHKLDPNDTQVAEVAEAVAKHMNDLLRNEPYCAHLRVHTVLQANVEKSTMNGMVSSTNSEYLITVKMYPGGGLFEATVLYDSWFGTYSVFGRVSRINLYGAQSFCVHNNILKLYCFCKH